MKRYHDHGVFPPSNWMLQNLKLFLDLEMLQNAVVRFILRFSASPPTPLFFSSQELYQCLDVMMHVERERVSPLHLLVRQAPLVWWVSGSGWSTHGP
ncbi:hypothetical protein PC129_g11665 [Phytophthora cactorum]|uniref:Uncharacterized protein n=1 Tax=Phytophthora cactorum TaxID=29920 RepID=A0A8T1BT19_9STRA|nr:hypothetical protein PC112_g16146 [Phytophthora cactorum]KAG2813485.1 hypothetical protein PC111_g14378 [Phytophthora cactorum]KAG2854190.1 hypothetical protein PC113_g13540 [Phytophthora cactorum]KAG2891321.1 hypothetical protein PC114_g17056 [Phytophthora cactorum]KAG2907922.1 hypothetical protein PC115_g13714 [Phytophthora cactorum]